MPPNRCAVADPAKLLALSTATALATPFEDHFLDGTPLIKGAVVATAGELRAWSGVRLGQSYWLVLTPGDQQGHTAASTLTVKVTLPPDGSELQSMEACDLTTGEAHTVTQTTATSITISKLKLTRTTVLQVAAGAAAKCAKLPSDVWLPEPGYNFPLKTDDGEAFGPHPTLSRALAQSRTAKNAMLSKLTHVAAAAVVVRSACACIPCGSSTPKDFGSGDCGVASAVCSATSKPSPGCYTTCNTTCNCGSKTCGAPSPAPPMPAHLDVPWDWAVGSFQGGECATVPQSGVARIKPGESVVVSN